MFHGKQDYEAEFQAAALNHPCALFSYEDLEQGKRSMHGEKISGLTVYRGWMMKPGMYRAFYHLLEQKGILLINTPEEYENYHLLPNWFEAIKDETPESIWTNSGKLEDAIRLTRNLLDR